MKKLLLISAIGATLLLGGCVAVPYDSPYPYAYGGGGPYYAAPYGYVAGPYIAPSVSFGFGYGGYCCGHGGWGGRR